MRGTESFKNTFAAAGSSPVFDVNGGYYALTAHSASWGGGNVTVNILLPDGTYFPLTTLVLSADGIAFGYLPPGNLKFVLTTTTAANVALTRVPFE